jgi:hypothetical protein
MPAIAGEETEVPPTPVMATVPLLVKLALEQSLGLEQTGVKL